MSVIKEVSIATIKLELEECQEYCGNYNWLISELDEVSMKFTVQMISPVDNEKYLMEIEFDDYPEIPLAIEFIDPLTSEKGTRNAYPKSSKKYGGFFINTPCLCNPCSRLAYKGYKNAHQDWQLIGWKNNPKVGNLTNLKSILCAIYFRLNNEEIYNGRMV